MTAETTLAPDPRRCFETVKALAETVRGMRAPMEPLTTSSPDRAGAVAVVPAFEEAGALVIREARRGYGRETLALPLNGRPLSELDRCPAGPERPKCPSSTRAAGAERSKCQETE